jgi:hypothetical protein
MVHQNGGPTWSNYIWSWEFQQQTWDNSGQTQWWMVVFKWYSRLRLPLKEMDSRLKKKMDCRILWLSWGWGATRPFISGWMDTGGQNLPNVDGLFRPFYGIFIAFHSYIVLRYYGGKKTWFPVGFPRRIVPCVPHWPRFVRLEAVGETQWFVFFGVISYTYIRIYIICIDTI